VFDAIVLGIPDERLGQRVAALVQLRDGTAPPLSAILDSAREVIAGYKVPRSVWIVDEIPRLHTGKTDFKRARQYADEHAGDDLCEPRSAISSV
jgi:acyl-CoA synthetase (AMP-forming)/AMP-acid ligase II